SAMIDKLIDLSAVSFVLYDGVSKQNFIFNDWVPTSISALSLHDALPIWGRDGRGGGERSGGRRRSAGRRDVLQSAVPRDEERGGDRKSTRLNSSHVKISYAVFCLKKKISTTNRRSK